METIIPFSTLPACAASCGNLYDANGACAPAGATSASSAIASCFCANSKVSSLSAGLVGVCDSACAAQPAGLTSIRDWFTAFCANPATLTGAPNLGGPAATTSGPAASTSTKTNVVLPTQASGDWISGHWQWVVMLVVMVVAIAGIWVGACIWRRRYLRKKDRQYALGKRGSAAALGAAGSGNLAPGGHGNASTRSVHLPSAGMFMPAPISSAAVYGPETAREKRDRKKWNPAERT